METEPSQLSENEKHFRALRAPYVPVTDFHQLFKIKLINEWAPVNFKMSGEMPEDLWAEGAIVERNGARRSNFMAHGGRWVKAFPVRYRLDDFELTRRMRRVIAGTRNVEIEIGPLTITPAMEELYHDHYWDRFVEPTQTLAEIYKDSAMHPAKLMEVCAYDVDNLVAFSIFEVGDAAIKANLNAWGSTLEKRSLGTLMILKEVEYAKSIFCDYYYMGLYHIHYPGFRFMTKMPGMELYDWDNQQWIKYDDPTIREMLRQDLPEITDADDLKLI